MQTKVILGFDSAIEYWRLVRMIPMPAWRRTRSTTLPVTALSSNEFESLTKDADVAEILEHLSRPLHVVVRDEQVRNRIARDGQQQFVNHMWGQSIAPGSLVAVTDTLLVSSPAFVFLQMAAVLSKVELFILGMEQCGRFVYRPQSPGGFVSCDPVAETASLAKIANTTSGSRGHRAAVSVASWLLDDAYSPAEAELAAHIHLPRLQGGYGIKHIVLNPRIDLSAEASAIAGRLFVRPDLYSARGKTCLEYDSDAWHSKPGSFTSDARKRSALACMGVDTITVTNDEMTDERSFNTIARTFAKRAGARVPPDSRQWLDRRLDLRRQLGVIRRNGGACPSAQPTLW